MNPDPASYKRQSALFKALAHPVRLRILDLLEGHGESCVCHLTAALGKRQPYVSQQLMVLREAGLVTDRRDGLMVYYRLHDDVQDLLVAGRTTLSLPAPTLPPQPVPGCTCPHCAPRA